MTYDLLVLLSDQSQSNSVCQYLRSKHMRVMLEMTVKGAIQQLRAQPYSFLLLDQRVEGADLLMDIVLNEHYRISTFLIVTGICQQAGAHAEALRNGADICLYGPISPDDIFEQLKAILRRQSRGARHPSAHPILLPVLKFTELVIDPVRNIVLQAGHRIHCTPKEFDVLYLLASSPERVFAAQYIYETVWGFPYDYSNTSVSDCISSIRKSLGRSPDYIETVYGRGYRFVDRLSYCSEACR